MLFIHSFFLEHPGMRKKFMSARPLVVVPTKALAQEILALLGNNDIFGDLWQYVTAGYYLLSKV